MTAVTTHTDTKQTLRDLEAAVKSLVDTYEEATGMEVSMILIHDQYGTEGKVINKLVQISTRLKL